jgi:hypothetical protein
VREFLELAFPLAGVRHTWLSDDRVRLDAHPDLAFLFGEHPTVDLAVSDRARFEYPEATPCVPGSFALEQLLQWASRLPAAFASRVCLSLPIELPPGLPRPGNFEFRLTQLLPGERVALSALVRVRMRTDLLAEQQIGLVLDDQGRLREEWGGALREVPRAPAAGPDQMPDYLFTALEEAICRAAARVAESQLPAVEARRQGELQRLEQFHRAIRDELHEELPSGALRQAAQLRSDARTLLEDLRTCLGGSGPWNPDTVRNELWPKPRLAFRVTPRHAPGMVSERPMRSLPPERQEALSRLLERLPRSFTHDDAERIVQESTERRISRLRRNLAEGESAGARLNDEETRLDREHRERVARVEEQLQMRVVARPILLEWLLFPVLCARVAVGGTEHAPIELIWNSIDAAWEPPVCPGCRVPGTATTRLWLAEDQSVGCDLCASRCASCGRVHSAAQQFQPCAACAEAACERCGRKCDGCGGWCCGRHRCECLECALVRCGRCGTACRECGTAVCTEHHEGCSICRKPLCSAHRNPCCVCEQPTCREHSATCPHCARRHCSPHSARCRFCGQQGCAGCVGPEGVCRTCSELAPAGDDTAAALRSLISSASPASGADRCPRWWFARNTGYTVAVGRRAFRNCLFVISEEDRTVIAAREYLSLLPPGRGKGLHGFR